MCYKDEVQRQAAKKLNKQLDGVPKFISDFFISKPKVKSKLTQLQYWNVFKCFFNYLIDNGVINKITIQDLKIVDMQKIKTNDINRFLIYCRDDLGNSADTIKTKYNSLCSLFSYFMGDDIVTKNIMDKVEVEEPKQQSIKYATLKDRDDLIHNLGNMKNEFNRIRNIAIVYLLMGSGIRISELIGLNMDDLHLNDTNPWIFVYRKGGETSQVYISYEAKIALEEYLLIRPERVGDSNKNIVFLSERVDKKTGCKKRIAYSTIAEFLDIYSNGKITAHMFRKGLAKLIVNSDNGGYSAAAQQLGHSTIATTKRWYATINEDKIVSVLNSF